MTYLLIGGAVIFLIALASYGEDQAKAQALQDGLNIANSSAEKEALQAAYHDAMVTGVTEAINSDAEVQAKIREAWVGEDCDAFLAEFEQEKQAAIEKLEGYYKQVESTLDNVEGQWDSFRQTQHWN